MLSIIEVTVSQISELKLKRRFAKLMYRKTNVFHLFYVSREQTFRWSTTTTTPNLIDMKPGSRHRISAILSGLLILLFVYAAASKLLDLRHFRGVLSVSPLLKHTAYAVSIGIPLVEIGLAGLLFMPRTRAAGFLGSAVLLAVFTGYIAYMLAFTPALPCSCGGVLKALSWKQHLLFNIAFIVIAALGWILSDNHQLFMAINRDSRTPVEESRQTPLH
ncbi:MAG TPA: MauE/DoxX family redox-associated membrane protein [Chitinophagaceae bacterium]|jgi:hypothetical protein